MLGEHEIELELHVLELRLRDEAAAALTRRRLSADNDAVLDRPADVGRILRWRTGRGAAAGGDDPAAEILTVEQRLPVTGRPSGSAADHECHHECGNRDGGPDEASNRRHEI